MVDTPDVVAKRLAAAMPDASVAAELMDAVRAGLSADAEWDAVAVFERLIAWLQAEQAASLARAAAVVPAVGVADGHDWAQEELAPMLSISAGAAAVRLDTARKLASRPRAADLLSRGEISLAHVRALLEETDQLTPEQIAEIDEVVLGEAPGRTPAAFRKIVRRAVLARMSREEQRERIAQAAEERFVAATYHRDGVSGTLRADMPAPQLALVMATLTGMARTPGEPGDERSMNQKRADALVQSIVAAGEQGLVPVATEQRLKPAVQVSVAMSTVLGLDNQPGELDGHPIPAELAVRIASDPTGTWRRLVTDEVGKAVDYGRSTYRPPPDLTEQVIARDRTCVWPGCHQPARRTEIDHRQRWVDGGETNAENLQCLCVGHHHCKEAGWRCYLLQDGSIKWISPTGRVYIRPPATYPIDTTGVQTNWTTSSIESNTLPGRYG